MNIPFKTGFSFGLASGVITTLGMIVGLSAGTNSREVVLGGVLTIALADSMSDALGVHLAQESQKVNTTVHIWTATFSTLIFKLLFALSFLIPLLIFRYPVSIAACIIWGLSILGVYSYFLAISRKEKPIPVILEHVGAGVLVVIATQLVGKWINLFF